MDCWTHNLMDALVEPVIFAEDQQHNQRHVNVVCGAVGPIVQRVQYRGHQLVNVRLLHAKLVEPQVAVQQNVEQQRGLINGHNATQGVVEMRKVDPERGGVLLGGRLLCIGAGKQCVPVGVFLGRVVIDDDQDEQETLVGERVVLAEGGQQVIGGEYVRIAPGEGQQRP